MEFRKFNECIQAQFAKMCATGMLFRSTVTGQEVWDAYLGGFLPENNVVFRDPNTSEHDCQCCRNFIRRYGNILAIREGEVQNIFTGVENVGEYTEPSIAVNNLLFDSKIKDVFFETHTELNFLNYEKCNKKNTYYQLGIVSNFKQYNKAEANAHIGSESVKIDTEKVYEFPHFNMPLPTVFVDKSGDSIEKIMADYRSNYDVFKRMILEIPLDTFQLAKDLINQDSLLNGTSHLPAINIMMDFAKQYAEVQIDADLWIRTISYGLSPAIAKLRNTLIGTFLVEVAEGVELNKACKNYNVRADPTNYHKAKAPITKAQIKRAQEFVEENDYVASFDRRLATLDDISASEILHLNEGDGEIPKVSMFDSVKPSKSTRHKRSEFDKVEEMSIEKFMKDVLPSCTSVEAFFTSDKEDNLVAITTANQKDSKSIFKWDNNYSWTFNGNLTGKSQLKTAVAAKGGRVDGAFRFSHSWNELEPNGSLMDLHVFMPGCRLPAQFTGGPNLNGRRVGWNHRTDHLSGGSQDVDYTSVAPKGYIPVENITFPNLAKMPEGKYTCMIHNWSFRQTGGKGKAEIEFGSNIYQYEYPATKNHEWITIAEVTLKDDIFTIEHKLDETNASKEVWGLDTNEFHKVNLMCLSPNHWGSQKVGALQYMFMLDKCATPIDLRGFHNENLIAELSDHRKVLEVLGNTSMITPTPKHLAGLGFNSTVRDELIVKCTGSFKRMLKIKF